MNTTEQHVVITYQGDLVIVSKRDWRSITSYFERRAKNLKLIKEIEQRYSLEGTIDKDTMTIDRYYLSSNQ